MFWNCSENLCPTVSMWKRLSDALHAWSALTSGHETAGLLWTNSIHICAAPHSPSWSSCLLSGQLFIYFSMNAVSTNVVGLIPTYTDHTRLKLSNINQGLSDSVYACVCVCVRGCVFRQTGNVNSMFDIPVLSSPTSLHTETNVLFSVGSSEWIHSRYVETTVSCCIYDVANRSKRRGGLTLSLFRL